MIIEKVVAGPIETNAYLVGCEITKKGIIIDPGFETSERLLQLIEKFGLVIEGIYLTHSHFDHIADVATLKKKKGYLVYVHEEDKENLRHPGSDQIPDMLGLTGVEPDGYFVDGEERRIGSLTCICIHTPGHSLGSVLFYFREQKVLFSGDTLFKGTYGRVDLPRSDKEKMKVSLEKIKKFPDDVVVYPGHGGSTTIGREKRWL
ncbi:MAG: MBL fold metallo-hydrolase [Chlamydiae bacterium]|nr:MBL fold metallo-hydrolase [Chlamydiota bacterium]